MITSDKFNRGTVNSKHAFIANNKFDVVLERYPNIKGTEIESLIRTFTAIVEEAERHENEGDEYFDYHLDKINARSRIDILISAIYKNEGNINSIENSIYFKNGKTEALELSDHYWACK